MRFALTAAAIAAAAVAFTAAPAAAVAAPPRADVKIAGIWYDSPGPDYGQDSSLRAEWIAVQNVGRRTADLDDWTIADRSGHRYEFNRVVLRPGQKVVLRTGEGRDTSTTKFWDREGRGGYVWNNDRDEATLRNDNGRRVDECDYRASRRDRPRGFTNCR